MGMGSSSEEKGIKPDMNITPLVDVVLVLLIIFMVIQPALEHGERVELPGITKPDKTPKTKLDPITVTIGGSGTLYFEKEKIEIDGLKNRLRQAHDESPDRRVVLKGDASLPYKKVRDIFVTTQEAGFAGIALMVQKRAGVKKDEE